MSEQMDPRTPDDDRLADIAALIVSLARRIQDRGHDNPRVVALSPLEMLAIRHIEHHPGVTPSTLANDLSLRSSNTSAALRILEQRGLIRREADPKDRRSVRVYVTDLATSMTGLVRTEHADLLRQVLPDNPPLDSIVDYLQEAERRLRACAKRP